MNIHEKLHALIDTIDCGDAKEQLHSLIDSLDEAKAREILERIRDSDVRHVLRELGFSL
jgi:hypothetical protein